MVARSPASQFADSVLPSLLFEQAAATLDRLASSEEVARAFISAAWALAVEEAGADTSAPPDRGLAVTLEGWRIVLLTFPGGVQSREPYAIAVAERAGTGRLFGLERGTGHDGRPTAYPCEQRPNGVKTRYGDLLVPEAPGPGPLALDHPAMRLFVDRVKSLLGPALRPPADEEPTPEPQLLVTPRPSLRRPTAELEIANTDPIPGRRTATPTLARSATSAFTPPADTAMSPPPPPAPPTLRDRLTPRAIGLGAGVLACIVVLIFQIVLWTWYIEDAAISFAFARHLAAGQGLVAYPGGERVEGYSNPTWVLLMALFELVHVDGFWSSKLLAIGLGFGTVALTFRIARQARPDRQDATPALAVLLLAVNAQFEIWSSSGLENSLFCFLLALAIERTLAEAGDALVPGESARPRFPWSAIAFLLLALSRPEGIAYAAVGGFYGLWFTWADGRSLGGVFRWLVAFFVPWTAYQAWHGWYFAYAFPSTYYAKMGDKAFKPFAWDARGWKQIRDWAWTLGQGPLLPVYLFAIGGLRARSWLIAGALMLLLAWPLADRALGDARPFGVDIWAETVGTYAEVMVGARVGALAVLALLAPLLAVDRPGARARMLSWSLAAVALAFALWANGDWMKAFRWMSMLAVPGSVLLAVGITELADAVQAQLSVRIRERWSAPGVAFATLLFAAIVTPHIVHVVWFNQHRETGPFSVKKRVQHVQAAAERLHIDRVRLLDIDQGAHLFWSGFEMMDIAGLVDVPMAQHEFEKPFVREYVFEEKKPDFAHVHGGWAATSKIPQHPEWARDYVEMPGYGAKTLHNGNFVRKDRIVDTGPWAGTPGRTVRFAGPEGAVLEGFELPADHVGQNQRLYLEIGLALGVREAAVANVGLIVFLSDATGVAHSAWVPPGYDWYEPKDWADDERFHGRFSFDLPDTLPSGTYDLGFVVIGSDGAVRPLDDDRQIARDDGTSYVDPAAPPGAVVGAGRGALPGPAFEPDGSLVLWSGTAEAAAAGRAPAVFAVGEVRFPGAVTIVSKEEADALSDGGVARAISSADAGDCATAMSEWDVARRRQTRRDDWLDAAKAKVSPPMGRCLAQRALTGDGEAQIADLEAARVWAPDDAKVRNVGVAAGARLYAQGLSARDAADWQTSYARLRDALRVDPSLAWARRYAEEARDHRLGIRDGKTPTRPQPTTEIFAPANDEDGPQGPP